MRVVTGSVSLAEKEDSAISTLVIRGSTDNMMDDIERAIDDGVNTFKVLIRVRSAQAGH